MRFRIVWVFLIALSSAAATPDPGLLQYAGKSLGSTPEDQIRMTKEILENLEVILTREGTAYRIHLRTDPKGNAYPELTLVPTERGSALNREAFRVAERMSGLPLVFSPYDLGRIRANAYFDAGGAKLGVSYAFILGDLEDPSYRHERAHARTYEKILGGTPVLFAGRMKLLSGEYLSPKNRQGYFRSASLDELSATALSLRLDTERAIALKSVLERREFESSHGAGADWLYEILGEIDAGIGLAHQNIDLANRALKERPEAQRVRLRLGKETREVPASVFTLDSYAWEITPRGGASVAQPGGAAFTLYWDRSPTPVQVQARLRKIIALSAKARAAFERSGKCIARGIELPDMKRTDWDCLAKNAGEAFRVLSDRRF